MKLLRVHIVAAETCGGLLDGVDIVLRGPQQESQTFSPLCLIGPNGAGKSQFLQVVAEIFQSLLHASNSSEERDEGNQSLQYEVEYLLETGDGSGPVHVRASRKAVDRKKASVKIERETDQEWIECDLNDVQTRLLLPRKVVGYTSGGNETLSLPFLLSRSGYADEVSRRALQKGDASPDIPDTRLMLIDYGTHLEVLVSNLLLGNLDQRKFLLSGARLKDLHSFRCVVQLAHSSIPRLKVQGKNPQIRKGVQLTPELEDYLEQLTSCATCHHFDQRTETYTFDFLVTGETRKAFSSFWQSSLELYGALHKLAMLNDLAIPKVTRERFKRETKSRRFASRLPEPQDEFKVFRFEQVDFQHLDKGVVDYVSLSDGEHQLAQLLGTFAMFSFPGVLFLLDEPESHFNPLWRVKFISRLLDLPGPEGTRRGSDISAKQDMLMTTHSPFVPSDMQRESVLIFGKDAETGKVVVRRPEIETFGATFDAILDECFDVRPPMADEARAEIKLLMKSDDPAKIKAGMEKLGFSVEKTYLADRLRQLEAGGG